MKVLFCFMPLYVNYNHGVALLSRLCKDKGIETDLHILNDIEKFALYLLATKPDYVSFSCVCKHDYIPSLVFIERARVMGFVTLLGGTYPRLGLCKGAADYVCEGDGESLPDFLLNCNLALFSSKQVTMDINSLPLPDYDLFKDIPFNRTDLLPGKVLPYYSSRGCPYSCSFCQVKFQHEPIRTRYKVEEDINEIVSKYKPDTIFFGDELLPYYNKKWRDSWGDLRFPFFAYIRADIPSDILYWLYERGMIACAFGIESGDERYRNEILHKDLLNDDIYRVVNILQVLGITYVPFYMVNTPLETQEIKEATLKMVRSIGGYSFLWEYEEINAIQIS